MLNKRNGLKRLIRRQNGEWVDVSKRKLIIYGAGWGCFELMNEMQLSDVSYVIDSNENKWGEEIELLNTIYKIQPPFLLSSIEGEQFCIVISSKEYEKEIREIIGNYCNEDILICGRDSIFWSYEQIEEMFQYDPLIRRNLLRSNLSFAIENIIFLFKESSKCLEPMKINRFIPSRGGESKLVFYFGNETKLWVFSIPGIHNEWEPMGIERDKEENKEIRYELRKRLELDRGITVYEDKRGILIQKYAGEYIDFNRAEIKQSILNRCRSLHQINEVIEIENDMKLRYFVDLTKKARLRAPSLAEWIQEMESCMKKVLLKLEAMKYQTRICHCDLSCSNVVCYDGEFFFIDWEYMAMCDPMFDVCGFLFSAGLQRCFTDKITYEDSLCQIYAGLKQDLSIYFSRACTEEEYWHAFLVMLVFEYRELMKEVAVTGAVTGTKGKLLLERMGGREGMSVYDT